MSDEMGILGLTIAAIFERLSRIEDRLGITEPTEHQILLDAEIDSEDEG